MTGTHLPIVAVTDAANQELKLFFRRCWGHLFNDSVRDVVINSFQDVVKSKADGRLDKSDKVDKEHNN